MSSGEVTTPYSASWGKVTSPLLGFRAWFTNIMQHHLELQRLRRSPIWYCGIWCLRQIRQLKAAKKIISIRENRPSRLAHTQAGYFNFVHRVLVLHIYVLGFLIILICGWSSPSFHTYGQAEISRGRQHQAVILWVIYSRELLVNGLTDIRG